MDSLLNYIARYESGGDYNSIYAGIAKRHTPETPLTRMTIKQILDWQDSIDAKYPSEACGRYQILEDTLREIYRPAGFSLSSVYNSTTQDGLALFLLKRRGLDSYMAGKISAETLCNNIAKEWASMPVVTGPNRGKSYYAGDGLNHTHAKPDEFLAIVTGLKTAKRATSESKGSLGAFVSAIIEAISGLFGGRK